MTLLTTQSISLFKNRTEINDGFRIPDMAYVHGKDFVCFEQLGGSLYFSNYWYGTKDNVEKFAEVLAQYFKEQYDNTPIEEGNYDFSGMVVVWHVGDNAVVANINISDDFVFFPFDSGVPPELEKSLKASKLTQLLSDGNDNSICDLIYSECSNKVKKELLNIVSEESLDDYIETAKENGITLKSPSVKKK